MDNYKEMNELLELMPQPVFCVRNGQILFRNHAAGQYCLEAGLPIADLLGNALQDYLNFQGSSLYIPLLLPGISLGACVSRIHDLDVFVVEEQRDELRALSLAATKIRDPLTEMLLLINHSTLTADPVCQGRMRHCLFQLQRLVLNMSDAARYTNPISNKNHCYMNICSVVDQIFQRISDLTASKNVTIDYRCPSTAIMTSLDEEKLERAIYNMVSNALKVTAPNGTIEAKLSCLNNRIHLSVRDFGPGIPSERKSDLYTRYLRQGSMGEDRDGIGLGMTLIRATAMEHGGTVLIDHPDQIGTRVTMTLSIESDRHTTLRSNILTIDYAGGQDHALLEFADLLPSELYVNDP